MKTARASRATKPRTAKSRTTTTSGAAGARPHGDDERRIAGPLLAWYRKYRRDLPWRRTQDPYAVWVSEMMLQQTQVATVRDYYERWMKRFPTVAALARSDEDDVLHAWQGLGYYSRARNLRNGARAVVTEHGGRVPSTVEALRALPGIGPYSAGAIASIAYGVRAALVDGNVVRVLCRLFGLRGDPSRGPLKNDLWRLAERLVPEDAPGDFNQALMELGATTCTPRSPNCDACPLSRECVAHRDGTVRELPELPKRDAPVTVARAAAVVWRRGRVLVIQVPDDAARWRGMWQFPNTDVLPDETTAHAAERALREAVALDSRAGERALSVRHTVTRYRITLDVHPCTSTKGTLRAVGCRAFSWAVPAELDALAMPAAHRRIAKTLSAATK
ncbi:MAG TPA: A/G-specific adenine glycosylase [Polyangiaceae bacterium]|nr:A/G-specific adenine glycosylase [Polyangiaceae bacterium]